MLRRPDLWEKFDETKLTTKSEKKVLQEARAEAARREEANKPAEK